MDEQNSDSNKHEITFEHAVHIPILPSVKSLMPYVEAVAVVIGSCHIHSVYEDRDYIKIYLKDKRFVDILVNNGVSILGRQINVDYAVPRADKVILSNVDPIVPDTILMKLLSYYGTPTSAIIHEKIATNPEYSHIECGKRKVYMHIFPQKKVPTKINFTYQSIYFRIDVLVEPFERNDVCEPIAPESEERNEDDNADVDVCEESSVTNMKPDVDELNIPKQPTSKQLAYHNRGKTKANSAAKVAHRLQRRARRGWFSKKRLTNQKKKQISLAVKKHLTNKKLRPKRKVAKNGTSAENPITVETESESLNEEMNDSMDLNFASSTINDIPLYITQYPLNPKQLDEFMDKTRFQRDPLQIVWEFLGENNKTPEALEALKFQLLEYYQVTKEQSLKFRIKRIVSSLKWPKDLNAE